MASLEPESFWKLVDQVLVAADRMPLSPEGPERKSIHVRDEDRVLQILAGPGSGKTELIVWRTLFELLVCNTPAESVMVTTFTRKAATELSVRVVERCDSLLAIANVKGVEIADPRVHDLRIGTIHSLCDVLLSEYDSEYLSSGTQVIDEIETTVRMARELRGALARWGKSGLVRRLLSDDYEAFKCLFRPPWLTDDRWPARRMEQAQFLVSVLAQHNETWYPRCAAAGTNNGIETVQGLAGLTADLEKLRGRWEEHLDKNGVIDFTTLQRRFLDRQAIVLDKLSHIFVDEFQDTNPIQFRIHTQWLQDPATRLTVVGDDDQALYRFRGSDIECFAQLGPHCHDLGINYRLERLEQNWRSTANITYFTQAFKKATVLGDRSMAKNVVPTPLSEVGASVRLIQGPWADICAAVADELASIGVGRRPSSGGEPPPSVAILMFSTSERESRRATTPASDLVRVLRTRDLRVYNPRNKTAGDRQSPVQEILGLLSYLIDPVSKAPLGKNGRAVQVWASAPDSIKANAALTTPPGFPVAADHKSIQVRFTGDNAGIGNPPPDRAVLFQYVDQIRALLLNKYDDGRAAKVRLSLAGLVARILSFPRYRGSGFTVGLFRQALFTALLEANIAPTRLTETSLDSPMKVTRSASGKPEWDSRFWTFLNLFGPLVNDSRFDDPDVEAFGEHAILVLTFHQAKGLEFDHVYVASTGRDPAAQSVLQTKLFSGSTPPYTIEGGQAISSEREVEELALADREREVYVALSRAKRRLTILQTPGDSRPFSELNPGIDAVFAKRTPRSHPTHKALTIREYTA